MCTQPLTIHKRNAATGQVDRRVVPCGRCHECLITKQNETAVLSYIEAVKRGMLVFATLTYNNDSFPMRYRRLRSVGDSREFEQIDLDFVQSAVLPYKRKLYLDFAQEDFSKILCESVPNNVGSFDTLEFCPSLRRKDFRDYLKRQRIAFERSGRKLPDFSYQAVGEYGEMHHRPHFHVLFYGLEVQIVQKLLEGWTKEFGYIDVKEVKRFALNGPQDGFLAVSRYLGKYVTKGNDDCPTVLAGIAEKSRILRSIGFGIPQPKVLASLLSFSMLRILVSCETV